MLKLILLSLSLQKWPVWIWNLEYVNAVSSPGYTIDLIKNPSNLTIAKQLNFTFEHLQMQILNLGLLDLSGS